MTSNSTYTNGPLEKAAMSLYQPSALTFTAVLSDACYSQLLAILLLPLSKSNLRTERSLVTFFHINKIIRNAI